MLYVSLVKKCYFSIIYNGYLWKLLYSVKQELSGFSSSYSIRELNARGLLRIQNLEKANINAYNALRQAIGNSVVQLIFSIAMEDLK